MERDLDALQRLEVSEQRARAAELGAAAIGAEQLAQVEAAFVGRREPGHRAQFDAGSEELRTADRNAARRDLARHRREVDRAAELAAPSVGVFYPADGAGNAVCVPYVLEVERDATAGFEPVGAGAEDDVFWREVIVASRQRAAGDAGLGGAPGASEVREGHADPAGAGLGDGGDERDRGLRRADHAGVDSRAPVAAGSRGLDGQRRGVRGGAVDGDALEAERLRGQRDFEAAVIDREAR